MWLLKLGVLVSLFAFHDSFAGPKDFGVKVHRHVIEVTEISVESPIQKPGPREEENMVARIYIKEDPHSKE